MRKQKVYGKLASFLKYKRHKRVRSIINLSKKKLDRHTGTVVGYSTSSTSKTHHLRKNQLIGLLGDQEPKADAYGYTIVPKGQAGKSQRNVLGTARGHASDWTIGRSELSKKKYKVNSFLFHQLCQYSRGRIQTILGKEFRTQTKTVPYRLSMSRFISNKILRSFYQNISKHHLFHLRQKIKSTRGVSAKAKELQVSTRDGNGNSKEKDRSLIVTLENRLDSSLLRLFQLKPLSVKKHQVSTLPRKKFPPAKTRRNGSRLRT